MTYQSTVEFHSLVDFMDLANYRVITSHNSSRNDEHNVIAVTILCGSIHPGIKAEDK